jgi:inosine/xanthosine triphosphate pyrophosphatase family protein
MYVKLTAAVVATLMGLGLILPGLGTSHSPVAVAADAPKADKKKKVAKPDFGGVISAVSEDGKTVTIEAKKKGEEAVKKDIKIAEDTTVEVMSDDKKLAPGLFAAVWFKEGSTDTAKMIKARAGKKK